MSRGGGGAQPPPRPGAQRSSLLPTARLERRRRQQASLKEKEMIVSLACPRGRPQPRPRCLPRTPAQVQAPKAGPQPPPRALTQGRGPAQPSPSGGARSPRPSLLPHRGSSWGCSRLPLPARTPLHPPRAKPESAPQLGMVPLQRSQGPGAHQREEAGLPRVWALGLFSWDTPWLPPSVFSP